MYLRKHVLHAGDSVAVVDHVSNGNHVSTVVAHFRS